MLDTVIAQAGPGRLRAYPIGATLRVSISGQNGTIRYFVSDGYAGVQLDGEQRVDEYQLKQLSSAVR